MAPATQPLPPDLEEPHKSILLKVSPYTITSAPRVYALIDSVNHILRNDIPGTFLECGVYRGGSMMAVALALLAAGVDDRMLYLFDTYEGMPAPDEVDVDFMGRPAADEFRNRRISDVSSTWVNASLGSVKHAMSLTGYPEKNMVFVKGMVEETIPESAPESIALLRLDTDWYQSTKHELNHLYSRVPRNGVVVIDDYGWFRGARQAVDEFFAERGINPYLHRVDYTARLIIKDE